MRDINQYTYYKYIFVATIDQRDSTSGSERLSPDLHQGRHLRSRVIRLDDAATHRSPRADTPRRRSRDVSLDGAPSGQSSRADTPCRRSRDDSPDGNAATRRLSRADKPRRWSREVSSDRPASRLSLRADMPPLPLDPETPLLPSQHTHISGTVLPPEVSPAEVATLPTADPELLQSLGIFEAKSDEWGPDILEELARRWEPSLKDGIKKELREEIHKKYPLPKNCPLMKPPTLNPEILAVLNESAKNRDGRLMKKQAQLGCVFTILGRTMSDILTKSISTPEVLRNLADMATILADSHYSETETRRSLITPMLDKAFIEPFKHRKRDSHLFGDKLGDFIKTSRGIQKTGKLIQPSSNLNPKGPAPRYQQLRPLRQVQRVSETRAPQYHRRAAYQPNQKHAPRLPPPLLSAQTAATAAPPYRKQALTKRKQ